MLFMIRAFSPGSTTQMQLLRAISAAPPSVSSWLTLLVIVNDYILIQMQEKYTKQVSGYKLTDRNLGRGSFSEVFLAYARDKRKLAVKVIPRNKISESDLASFESEVRLLHSIKHENIVELIDFKKSQNNFYLFLQYCQGGNLSQYIKTRQKLPQIQALKIFGQIIKGVSAMHQFKIVHRDLKPANILLKKGKVKIADFGLACKFSKNEMLRAFVGTPLNMAPEILKGNLYNQKVDIYSVGTLLHEMLYGVVPYQGRDTQHLLQAIQKGKIGSNTTLISQRIKKLLKDMLRPKPEQRINLEQLLDFISIYEKENRELKLDRYRKMSMGNGAYVGATGGLFCNFDIDDAAPKRVSQMDMRLYNKLCRKLSVEAIAN